MIKYLPLSSRKLSSTNIKKPTFGKVWSILSLRVHHHLYDLMISLVLQTAGSYPENSLTLNSNNYKVIKSFRES